MKTNMIKVGVMASLAASLFMAGSLFAQEAGNNGQRRPGMAPGGMQSGPQGMQGGMQGGPRGMQGGMQGGPQGMQGGMQGGAQGMQGGMRGGPQGMQGGMQGGPQGMQGDSMRMVIRQLDLSDDQKAKIQELSKANREKSEKQMTTMAALQKKLQAAVEAGDEAAITAAGQELGKALAEGAKIRLQERKAIEAILTPEQREKATKLRKEMEEKRAVGGPGLRPPRPEGEEGGQRPPRPEDDQDGGDRPPPPDGAQGGDRPPRPPAE